MRLSPRRPTITMRIPGASTDIPAQAQPYSPARMVAATALLILVLSAATSAMLFVSLEDTFRQEKTNLRNLAIAFSAQTFSVAQAIDNVMLEAERGVAANATVLPMADSMAREYLLGIYLYDTAGQLVASRAARTGTGEARTPVSPPASDIAAVLDSQRGGLRITVSDVDPITGRGVISFSRATVDAGGKRNGAIVAEADSERFERIYSLVALGKGGSVTLFNRAGTMLVRAPEFPTGIGRSFVSTPLFQHYLPNSSRDAVASTSPLDGQQRLYGYDAVSRYPLVLVTAKDQSDALAPWYERLWTALISLALISMTVIFLAWRVARDARRQSGLIGKLAESEARAEKSTDYLAAILNAASTPIWVLDSARKIVMLNEAFCRFVGRGAAELVGQQESDVFDPANAGERGLRYEKVLDGGVGAEATAYLKRFRCSA
jgi:PAS domain-containing protein